jgi:hypothetical protein
MPAFPVACNTLPADLLKVIDSLVQISVQKPLFEGIFSDPDTILPKTYLITLLLPVL